MASSISTKAVDPEKRKAVAKEFLTLAATGKARDAAKRHLAAEGSHHSAFFPAGWEPLIDGMMAAHKQAPRQEIDVKHILCEGDMVAVHSHVRPAPGSPGIAVVHLFRFFGDKIDEMWDVGQELPKDSPNTDAAF